MTAIDDDMEARISRVRSRIESAAARSGRDPSAITLVAVSKVVPVERIRLARDLGVRVFGENRIQEARSKIPEVGEGVSWHLVGHLQRNKVREAVLLFDLIHSVDSLGLAAEIGKRAEERGKVQAVLLEVNVSGEASKFGFAPGEVAEAYAEAAAIPGIRLRGLMTIPPAADDPEMSRTHFRRLRAIAESLGSTDRPEPGLSMGMTGDFEVAIEEGATWVRIGTAIFGERPGPNPRPGPDPSRREGN